MSSTVFVRNLAFASTSAELEELFSEIGPLKHAFVVTEAGVKADAANAGGANASAAIPGRSRGFGFVEFRVPEDAARAIVEYQVRAYIHNARIRDEMGSSAAERFLPQYSHDFSYFYFLSRLCVIIFRVLAKMAAPDFAVLLRHFCKHPTLEQSTGARSARARDESRARQQEGAARRQAAAARQKGQISFIHRRL
jgi:RNA recognition motif-containing protein